MPGAAPDAALADAVALEALLARLYTDAALRQRFLAAPEATALQAGLAPASARALAAVDREGLALAAASLAARRTPHAPVPAGRWARLRQAFARATGGG